MQLQFLPTATSNLADPRSVQDLNPQPIDITGYKGTAANALGILGTEPARLVLKARLEVETDGAVKAALLKEH